MSAHTPSFRAPLGGSRFAARIVSIAAVTGLAAACADSPTMPSSQSSLAPSAPSLAAGGGVPGPTCQPNCKVDPGKILFYDTTSNARGIVYSVNPDGSGLRGEYVNAKGGAWIGSSKSQFVLSVSFYNQPQDVFVGWTSHDPNIDGLQQMTFNPAPDLEASTSPDGNTTVFVSTRDGNREIYTLDTWNYLAATEKPLRLAYASADDRWPHFAPSGNAIVFASNRGQSRVAQYHIWKMGASGAAPVQLNAIEGRHPVYSPDGSKIAFTTSTAAGDRIAVMSAIGDNLAILQNGLTDSFEPSWSRDGLQIAFASTDPAFKGINVMKADGSNVKHVVSYGHMPKWAR